MGAKARQRAARAAAAASALALLFYIGARIATVLCAVSPDNPIAALGPLVAGDGLAPAILDRPWHLALGDMRVALAGAAAAGVPAAIAAGTRIKAAAYNDDTEGAHGSARLAEASEMGDLLDGRCGCNNILYTEHAGICRTPWNKKTKEAQYGRNLNCITLGISGQGKTFNLATPDIMQATGDALIPYRCGYAARVLDRLRYRGQAPATDAEAAAMGLKVRSRIPEAARAAGAGAGSDLFITDPKGGMLLDTGRMLEAAGYRIRCMNTVDFDRSCHINPFAYVGYSMADVKDAAECAIRIDAKIAAAGEAQARSGEIRLAGPSDAFEWSTGAAVLTVKRTSQSAAVPASTADVGCDRVAEATGAVIATATSGTVVITVENLSAVPVSADITLTLDGALKVEDAAYGDARSPEFNKPHDTISSSEDMPDARTFHAALDLRPRTEGAKEHYIASLPVSCKQEEVPDGAALTKLVDTFVANLGGTDAAANKSEDPFWEDTKRLAIMSLAAYLVERYGHDACTIPNIMQLLNRVLADTGNPHDRSPMRELIDEWEYGMRTEVVEGPDSLMEPDSGTREVPSGTPHPRERSLAVMCYRAFTQAADDTVLSIIISCRAALSALVSAEIQEVLSCDELHLELLGTEGQKSAVFCVTSDTPSPFDFLTAMVVQLAIDQAQEVAYRRYGGKLPRHVRFILDEVANIGKIPVLIRAIAVVRSRNISISMFVQSKSQIEMVYGKEGAQSILDNCTTWLFLGAQVPDTLDLISNKIGDETVFTRVLNRSFNGSGAAASGASESISSTARKVRSATQLQQMASDTMLCFMYNHVPIEDKKIKTARHPLYRYINPGDPRGKGQPPAAFSERFDYADYLRRERDGEVVAMT